MKITLSVELPDELAPEFLQTIRDFDMKYDPEHSNKVIFKMLAKSDLSVEEMEKILGGITPKPQHMLTIKRI